MQLSTSTLNFSPRSLVCTSNAEFGFVQTEKGFRLVVLAPTGSKLLDLFEGQRSEFSQHQLMLCELNHRNAETLRSQLEWLRPGKLGLKTSAGMGDRIGLATPGHVRAARSVQSKVTPIFAQQSMREMKRTGRGPQQVMDEAMWGIFEEGWRNGAGADADHLKTKEDIDACLAAGFTFYTFDPSEYVDHSSHTMKQNELEGRLGAVPAYLQPEATGLSGKSFDFDGHSITFNQEALERGVVKFGRALDHIADMYQHLQHTTGNRPYEVEISMDETELPTSPAEHVYIARELHRLGIKMVSFAPHFVGRFEKGVDYIGDLESFKEDVSVHAAIARQLGPYKLSLHSGSDKFSIYPIFVAAAQGLAHIKTAGTSYLEALAIIAELDHDFIRDIYTFARERYKTDRQSYHVSARLDRAPLPGEVKDWNALLNQFDAREILHVTFGSVVTEKNSQDEPVFYERILSLLKENRQAYFEHLKSHFERHLRPFSMY